MADECNFKDCDRKQEVGFLKGKGYCRKHYQKLYRDKELEYDDTLEQKVNKLQDIASTILLKVTAIESRLELIDLDSERSIKPVGSVDSGDIFYLGKHAK